MPNRPEVIKRLRDWALDEKEERSNYRAHDLLTQAADLLEQGESRTEYRIVGERLTDGSKWEGAATVCDINSWDFKNEVRELGERSKNIRIQQRTVTETEWTDVEGEADRG